MNYLNRWKQIAAFIIALFAMQAATAGVWLDIEENKTKNGIKLSKFKNELNWLDAQNNKNTAMDPWMGMRVFLKWGQIPYKEMKDNPFKIQYDFSLLVTLLNEAYYPNLSADKNSHGRRSYKVLLTVSDKLWIYEDEYENYNYFEGALPRFYAEYLKGGNWNVDAVTITKIKNKKIATTKILWDEYNGVVDESLRFAVMGSNTNGKRDARKYSATRWNSHVKKLWFEFWRQLSEYKYQDPESGVTKKLRDHPALHAIITPESSLSGIRDDEKSLNIIEYSGAQNYSDLLLRQAKMLKGYFPNLPVISSINWISDATQSPPAPYYQNYLGDELSSLNASGGNYGWFAQDLRIDGRNGIKNSYQKSVYPEFKKFVKNQRYVMITGDSYTNSQFSGNSNNMKARDLVELAHGLDVGHLVFLKQNQGANTQIFSMIANAGKNKYSFLPSSSLSMIKAVVYEENHPNRIAVNLSDTSTNVSASDFFVTVDGRGMDILSAESHPQFHERIWLTLSERIYTGQEVVLSYYGNGTIVGENGNPLQAGQLVVSNQTETDR